MSSKSPKPSVTYTLFLYRQELASREVHYMRLNKTKMALTDNLLRRSLRNIKNCTPTDMEAISRELLFKKKLQKQILRIHLLEKLGIKNADPNAQITKL